MGIANVIEILKIIFGWPVIALIIVLLLRKPIIELLRKIGKAKFGSAEVEFNPPPDATKLNEIKNDIATKVLEKDPKLLQVAARFEYWLKNYDHHGDSPTESFRKFIIADKAIVEYGINYEEYKQLAEILSNRGVKIDYVIPEPAFREQFELSRERIRRYSLR